jgi:site-specific recombinase XerD
MNAQEPEALLPSPNERATESALSARPPGVLVDWTVSNRPLEQNPAAVYLAGLAAGSRRTMREALDVMAGMLTGGRETALTFDWSQLRFQHTAALRSRLAERYRAATANKLLSALRGVLRTAWRLGQLEAEACQRACDLPRIQGETLPAGRSLAAGELAALLEACRRDGSPAGARDAAVLALLYGCGLRRAELAALRLEDYDPQEGALNILGKRNKQRRVPVVGGAKAALEDWLAARGAEPGFLFVSIRRGGHLQSGGMTAQAVYLILQERAKQAGVAAFSPHDLRRTFVGDLLDRGADIATVQKLAGHANVTTTARYDRRGDAAKRQAAELLHVPYRPDSR